MAKTTTIVTAIPYVNGTLHIGNVLTTLSGDVTARYHRMRGENVFFVAGTDENGLKIKDAAEAAGKSTKDYVAELATNFRDTFRTLEIYPDDFVRTTEERHIRASQEVFRRLQDTGYIYEGVYEGWYDVSTETFFKDSELVDGKSPDGNPVTWVSEANFYFKLSAFQERLLELIEGDERFIVPEPRRNEVISFIKQGLRDAAISRKNPGWGIPVPGHEDQVIYVWFDALINYITATGWPDAGWEDKWPPIVQWVGKDILTRFHATLWIAMLMGLNLPLPKAFAAHSWIVLGGGVKIAKSKGNVVEPIPLALDLSVRSGCSERAAIDALRSYLVATMPFESDSTFSYEDFDRRYNNDLANDLGNALNRCLSMAHRFVGGIVPDAEPESPAVDAIVNARLAYEAAMSGFELHRASEAAFGLVRFLNKYVDAEAPWALAKANDPRLAGVVYSMLLCLRSVETLIAPIMPFAAVEIATQLGLAPQNQWSKIGTPETLPPGTVLGQPVPIFPRLDLSAAVQPISKKKEPKVNTPTETAPASVEISIEEFAKVQLRIGRVLEAEPIEGADKLLKVLLDIDGKQRQIVAGIRKQYAPEDLIGRQVVVCVNLKPAKLRGVESQGMLLAAVDADGGAILLQPEREAPEGALVR